LNLSDLDYIYQRLEYRIQGGGYSDEFFL